MGRMLILDNFVNKPNNQIEGFCVIKSVAERINAKGDSYLDFKLADSAGAIAAKLWDYKPLVHGAYEPNTIVKIRATIVMWNDREQLKIDRIRPMDKTRDNPDMRLLVPCAPLDPEFMFDEIYVCADNIKDSELSFLVKAVMNDNREDLMRWPAAVKLHHAQRGGLLYHTYTMLRVGKAICGIYTDLDSDLVYAGIILHDMSKMKELSVGELGLASEYSVEGQLIGHISLGSAMVERVAARLGTPDEIKMLVQHMILAHHGVPEFGSPRMPMFPEAEVVSEIDHLDAALFEMFEALDGVEKGKFSEKQWALDNRMLYKHGHNMEE